MMWLVMRGALSEKVETIHSSYYLPSMTPVANLIMEERSDEAPDESQEEYLSELITS